MGFMPSLSSEELIMLVVSDRTLKEIDQYSSDSPKTAMSSKANTLGDTDSSPAHLVYCSLFHDPLVVNFCWYLMLSQTLQMPGLPVRFGIFLDEI